MRYDEQLHQLCQDHGINVVYLFDVGASLGATQEGYAQVGLVFAPPRGSEDTAAVHPVLLPALQDLFGSDKIAIVYLQQASPLLQFEGIRGRLLYLADDEGRADFEDRVLRDYLDFAFEMRLFSEEVAEEIQHGKGEG